MAASFIFVLQIVFKDYLQRWGFTFSQKDIRVDEDLPDFYSALRLANGDELIDREEMLKEKYGFEILDHETVDKLKLMTQPQRPM